MSASQWAKSFAGTSGHPNTNAPDETDSEAGGYVKLILPFAVQPFQVYWQRDGEDSRQRSFGFPYKFADLYGINLPRLLSFERIGLRAEYAENHIGGWPDFWYTHTVYTSGMTYRNTILGHHMGTDSNDLSFEVSCRIPEAHTRLLLSYDKETHNLSEPAREHADEVKLTAVLAISENIDADLSFGRGRIENPGSLPGPPRSVQEASTGIRYRF